MYLPDAFEEKDPTEVEAVLRDHPLACIVAQTSEGLVANHIPLLSAPDGTLIGHVAVKNDLHRLLAPGHQVLAIFRGEDAYVTPNGYPSKPEHHRHAPTWNYQVVHVHGTISFQHDEPSKRAAVGLLTRDHERKLNGKAAWRMADAPADYMTDMLGAIVAFRIAVTKVAAKSKLSQNREPRDHAATAEHLDARGFSGLAGRMKRQGMV
ncbi:FMN-binding negative transcriptional regulator [Paracoccus shanxieyensis]|uniref:FMN-binding negative transcriptional regulator n=1 Tax=Paracoccus shanxieyensis TaxID=2675752 RepID=A0A6L6J2B9_9RHOB|nr:FMN-binding negative transcriptional regulator [Paracoccus shanxieyensis]MTH66713.1 FMN-binding negative transcriptional regulator [Paracoccus shanxieyensis]MTH89948.1 FMN-binding negative transcriptional regulator [Paracoccus shanxieyensis]